MFPRFSASPALLGSPGLRFPRFPRFPKFPDFPGSSIHQISQFPHLRTFPRFSSMLTHCFLPPFWISSEIAFSLLAAEQAVETDLGSCAGSQLEVESLWIADGSLIKSGSIRTPLRPRCAAATKYDSIVSPTQDENQRSHS